MHSTLHRMYIRRGFESLASDAWLVKCKSCYQYSMYNWTPKFPCKNSNCRGSCIFEAETVLHIPLEVYFFCNLCEQEIHLFRLGQFGFFICLKCFHRPSFGENCNIKYIYPEQAKYEQKYGRLNLDVKIEFPQRWNAITYKLQRNTRLDASIYSKSIEKIFYPSKAICSRNWSGMLTKKIFVEALAWRCKHCHSLNEFEFTSKTLCANCLKEDDLTDFFQRLVGEERVSVEVVFILTCSKCSTVADIRNWRFFHNGISCPVCCQLIEVGKIEVQRTLRTWLSEEGEEKVITVQREDKWIYEMNTQFLSSFSTSNQESASSSQALTSQNIEKGTDDFDWGFEPSTSDAVSTPQ